MKRRKNKNLKTNSVPSSIPTYGIPFPYEKPTIISSLPLDLSSNTDFISLNESLLSSLYLTCPITQRVIKQPVEDALRGGIEIVSEELGDRVKEITSDLEENSILDVVKYAFIWSRLYGGSVILINSDISELHKELSLKSINQDSELEFYELSRFEIEQIENTECYKLKHTEVRLHKSRVIEIKNKKVPYHLKSLFKGWGYSEVEKLKTSLNLYNKANNVLFELTDEAKLDIYRISNLKDDLETPSGVEETVRMIHTNNYLKSYKNALVMDRDDEFQQKNINFSGIGVSSESARQSIVTASELNRSKILGEQPTGFSSDLGSVEDYNALVEGSVRTPMKKVLRQIIETIMQKLFSKIYEFEISYKSLRIMSDLDLETIKEKKTKRIIDLLSLEVISREEAKEFALRESLV